MKYIGTDIESEATFLTLGNLDDSDAKLFWSGLSKGTDFEKDFTRIHSICRGNIINMQKLISIIKEQLDLETGILLFFESPEFDRYRDIMNKAVNTSDELSLKQMELLNLILASENSELSVSSIPQDLQLIYEDLLKRNILACYRTLPIGHKNKTEHPVVTFLTPSVAYYLNSKKQSILQNKIKYVKDKSKREIDVTKKILGLEISSIKSID